MEIQNKAEAEEILKKEEEARNADDDDGVLGWIGAVLILIATIIICCGGCFVIFKTSCFHKPLFKERTNIQNDTAQPDQEESDEVEDYESEMTPKAVSKQSGMIEEDEDFYSNDKAISSGSSDKPLNKAILKA